MARARFFLTAAIVLLAGCDTKDKVLSHMPLVGGLGGAEKYLPENGAVPGLKRVGKIRQYRTSQLNEYLGPSANLFVGYGAENLAVADYVLGDAKQTLAVECYGMNSDVAAAGIFHYYRGRWLRGRGTPVEVGSEGVLDQTRENRNLYFYKQRYFFKIIYSGPLPVPDLTPLGRAVANAVPGTSERPRGFEFLEVEGVARDTAYVSPGYTFNCDFLPPGVFAKAPGAGDIAEVFIIAHLNEDEAQKTARDYRTYLQLNGQNYSQKGVAKGRVVWQARDPNQGRVMCTQHKQFVIGVVRPQTWEKAEALLDAIVKKIGNKAK
ncbi:MAG: hypothetical protein N3A66_05830 [Planctomycetota bacterium]|nr:hypothetical protein [Planctomycetota bacterium]